MILVYTQFDQSEDIEPLFEAPVFDNPVEEFAYNCIKDISIEAMDAIGEHGGYIDPYDSYLSDRQFTVNLFDFTESDLVAVSPQDNPAIPYWWYLKSENDCTSCETNHNVPTEANIESQIEIYLERKLPSCLNNFSVFQEQGFKIQITPAKPEVSIAEKHMEFKVVFPIVVARAGSTKTIEELTFFMDLKFRDIFNLAVEITTDQLKNLTLEGLIEHFIGIHGIPPSASSLPPQSFIDDEPSGVIWNKIRVESLFKELLQTTFNRLQVKGTKGATRIQGGTNAIQQGNYDIFFREMTTQPYPDITASFLYNPEWQIYLDVKQANGGSNGLILAPDSQTTSFPLSLAPTSFRNYYHFFYDYSFPVVVILHDATSLRQQGKEGFTFMFALEGNIRDNRNMLEWQTGQGVIETGGDIEWTTSIIDTTAQSCVQEGSKWRCPLNNQLKNDELNCNQICVTQTRNTVIPQSTPSLFCDYSQRLSGNVTIQVREAGSNNKLDEVATSFICGRYRTCPLGASANGEIISALPLCNGNTFFKMETPGYQTKIVEHGTVATSTEETINVQMEPLVQMTVDASYINVSNLFRVKREIIVDYFDMRTLIRSVNGTIRSQIQLSSNSGIQQGKLRIQEAALILSDVRTASSLMGDAFEYLKDVDHYHELDQDAGRKAARDVAQAITLVHGLVSKVNDDPEGYIDSIIRRDFMQDLTFDDAILQKIINLKVIWEAEMKNIQYVTPTELTSAIKIESIRANAHNLMPGEKVLLQLEKIKESIHEPTLPQTQAIIEPGQISNITLVPGQYEVNLMLIDEDGVVIPPNSGAGEFDFTPSLSGQIKLSNSAGVWTVTRDKLNTNRRVLFRMLRVDDPGHYEDLSELDQSEEYASRFRTVLEPEFLP